MTMHISQNQMETFLVRYRELIPCTTAFVDTRTPGNDRKENFTIIGPGVAENPAQHVHITTPHGFNIGGARQPPHCINSQHSHETAEVFLVHTGHWRFTTGHDGRGPSIDLAPGDAISIPVHVFRGFENVGSGTGFMFAVLGGDDPGRVTWAPSVFAAAERHGLVLLEGGRLIDTTKEAVPADAVRMRPISDVEAAEFDRVTFDQLSRCVQRHQDLSPGGGLSAMIGFEECPMIGVKNDAESMRAGKMGWSHQFQVRALKARPAARSAWHVRLEEEVILMQQGSLCVSWPHGRIDLGPGDTLTVPKSIARQFSNPGADVAVAFIVRGGDHPQPAVESRQELPH